MNPDMAGSIAGFLVGWATAWSRRQDQPGIPPNAEGNRARPQETAVHAGVRSAAIGGLVGAALVCFKGGSGRDVVFGALASSSSAALAGVGQIRNPVQLD